MHLKCNNVSRKVKRCITKPQPENSGSCCEQSAFSACKMLDSQKAPPIFSSHTTEGLPNLVKVLFNYTFRK